MTGVRIVRVDPADRRQVRAFVRMAYSIYRPYPLWVPPFERDVAAAIEPRNFPPGCDGAAFLAVAPGGGVVGRIAAFEHGPWNETIGESRGLFGLFECTDDRETASALLDAARSWASGRGLTSIEGPQGIRLSEGFGILTAGFEHSPSFGIPYNPPYYQHLLTDAGLDVKARWQSGYVDRTTRVDARLGAVAKRARRNGYEIVRLRTPLDVRRWVPRWLEMYNRAIDDPADWTPMLPEEAAAIGNRFSWFADPGLLKIVTFEGEPAGFLLAFPDVAAGQRAAGGRLLPIGWLRMLQSRLTTRVALMNGLGLVPEHRRTGAMALIADDIVKSLRTSRYELAELALVGRDNAQIMSVLRRVGLRWSKEHATFHRPI